MHSSNEYFGLIVIIVLCCFSKDCRYNPVRHDIERFRYKESENHSFIPNNTVVTHANPVH